MAITTAAALPIQNRGLEKARAGFDRNHRFNATAIYALPFGKGKKWMNRRGIYPTFVGNRRPDIIGENKMVGRNIVTGPRLMYSQGSVQSIIPIKERFNFQIRLDLQNVFHNCAWSKPDTTADFTNSRNFGKITADQRTSSVGG